MILATKVAALAMVRRQDLEELSPAERRRLAALCATLQSSRSRHLLPGRACFTISRLDAEPNRFQGAGLREVGTRTPHPP